MRILVVHCAVGVFALALLARAVGGAVDGQEPDRVGFDSAVVTLDALPASQRTATRADNLLRIPFELDGQAFSFEIAEGRLNVATESGEVPSRTLSEAGTLRLHWKLGEEKLERNVRFEPRSDGTWVYGAPDARLFDLDGELFCVVDANSDGSFDLLHDAWSFQVGAPLHPLHELLILGDREFRVTRLTRDGSRIEGAFQALEGNDVQRAALKRLNHLRAADGLNAVRLEFELSQGCSAHARYLVANQWDGKFDAHDQDPRGAETSREGLAAARRSEILALAPAQAMDALWAHSTGRLRLMDPDLLLVGISDVAGSLAVVDVRSRSTKSSSGSRTWSSPLLSPAPGSHGQPTHFAANAGAAPLKGAERMGPPLVCWLRETGADVESYSAELFKVSGGSRRRLSVVKFPEFESFEGVRGALPVQPLQPGSTYLIVHTLVIEGETRRIETRFATRE